MNSSYTRLYGQCPWSMILVVALACTIDRVSAAAEWVPVGPDGGDVVAVATDPGHPMRAWATSGGVFRTDDGGETWTPASAGLPSREVSTLAVGGVDAPWLYVATRAGVAVSTDGAASWAATTLRAADVFMLEASPVDGRLAIAVTGDGAYRTRDGGVTWSRMPFDAQSIRLVIDQVVFDPHDPSIVYAVRPGRFNYSPGGCSTVAPDGVFRSTDGGETWQEADTGIAAVSGTSCCAIGCRPITTRAIRALVADPHRAGALLVLTRAEHAAYRSTDGAATWTPIATDDTVATLDSVAFDPSTPGRLFALRPVAGPPYGAREILRSDDGGDAWSVLPPVPLAEPGSARSHCRAGRTRRSSSPPRGACARAACCAVRITG